MLASIHTAPLEAVGAIPATGAASLAWLLVAIPLASAAVLLVAGRRSDSWGHWLGVLAPVLSFLLGATIAIQLLGLPADDRVMTTQLYPWICLLYTSPSPRDGLLSRMPSS